MDYFLLRFTKQKVFKSNPRSIGALKQLIDEVINNFKKQTDLCIEEQGGHFEQFLKTK